MEENEYRRNAYDMIYLTACSIINKIPDPDQVDKIDIESLFEVCQNHILTACVAYALESVGIQNYNFSQAKAKAIRKNILLDSERTKILRRLESKKIWYMPLKGALLKDWYPKLGMRQMSDNDILCDGMYRTYIRDIMLDMGFTDDHFGKGNVDAYFKPPVYNFEIHDKLFQTSNIGKLYDYYANVKVRLIKVNDYSYRFRPEDFYIYIIAHEYKHFSNGGIGVRSLVDTYIFLQKFSDTLDWNYIGKEFIKLDISDYEKQNRELALKVFNHEKLSDEDRKLLDYYIFSGTYGTIKNIIDNHIKKYNQGSKLLYVLHRLFPPISTIRYEYPFFYKHKWMIALFYIYRLFKGILRNWKKIKTEISYLKTGLV